MARSYQLKARAERRDRTRQRIIEAAIGLHGSKGPAATTMDDIAASAQVGRVTVYRHFPDEEALFGACSGHYFQRHPLPDPTPWQSIDDATERFRRGFSDTYAYHAQTQAMMMRVLADLHDNPILEPYHAHWRRAARVLAHARSVSGPGQVLLQAALALALDFNTWRTLVCHQRLSNDQAVEVMLRLTRD
jgi:AcrR family transcriptional regulator